MIADVTGLNENVLYELGLAHALGKRTVMITQKLDDLPFDLRAYRANEYSMLFHKAGELKDLLAKVGEAVLRGEADFSNPIQDFAPYALGRATQPTVVPLAGGPSYRGGDTTDVDSASADDEPGFLEHRVALELGSAKVVQISERLGGFTEEVGNKFSGYSEKMVRANTNLGDRAAGALLAIARDAAEDLNLYAEQIEPLTGEMRTALGDVAAGTNAIARHGSIGDDEDAAVGEGVLESLHNAELSMGQTRASIEGFAKTMLELPNMERNLRRAARRAAAAVTALAEEIETGESEFARARGLLQERIDAHRRGQVFLT